MKVILIDDEQHAIDLLEFQLLNNFNDIEILGKFTKPTNALLFLCEEEVDLIFMDVNMPSINGLEMTTLLHEKQIPIVFVTAHSNYAINAIKLDVFDYLLKPINTEELVDVYEKAKKHLAQSISITDKIKFTISNRHVIVQKDEIVCVNSEGNYSTVFFTNRPELMITKNMKKMIEDYFSDPSFYRCHRSHLINLNHVQEFNNREVILSCGRTVGLARNNLDELKVKMGKR